MKQFFIRLINLFAGIILYAIGVAFTIKANIGYQPWDVFHAGFANITGLTIGFISILTGLVIFAVVMLLGEKIGFGSILCLVLVGVFLDVLLSLKFFPTAEKFWVGVIMLIGGLFITAVGSYFYIKSAFGAGARDSLMIVLKRKTRFPVGVCRSAVEILVTLIGWLLGGMFGWGTIIAAVAIGFCFQIAYKIFRFNVTSVKHESFIYTIKSIGGMIKRKKE